MTNKKNYADTLQDCAKIAKERQSQYGEATESIQLACEILDVTFGLKLTPKEFCNVIISLKYSRDKFQQKDDNSLDNINYTAIKLNL
jgi:hypothetical protein